MGTAGVPWYKPHDQIVQALKKHNGKLTFACKDLDCTYRPLRHYVDEHPELRQLVDDLRQGYSENLLDKAEDKILSALDQDLDLTNGLKAAFFVLNSKGDTRGYKNTNVGTNVGEGKIYIVRQDPTKCESNPIPSQVQMSELPNSSMESASE